MGSSRRNMLQDSGSSGELSGLRFARREIKNGCDLDPDCELVGMRHAVAYFGEYKPFLGSNLYDGSGFQGLRHQQFHSVLRGIQKVPLDLDHCRTKHPDRKRFVLWKTTIIKVQALSFHSTGLAPRITCHSSGTEVLGS